MRQLIKRISGIILIPLTRWYLRKERKFTYRGITIAVLPGIFHPGLFHSTIFLLDYLLSHPLNNVRVLELGCGTGLISIAAAKNGAAVTACDLNPKAIESTLSNAKANGVTINVIFSDLFTEIPLQTFDWIVFNPPFYAGNPKKDEELAWYAGADFEYFQKLFSQLGKYYHPGCKVVMVITAGTDLARIAGHAKNSGFSFSKIKEQRHFFEGAIFLYRIDRKA